MSSRRWLATVVVLLAYASGCTIPVEENSALVDVPMTASALAELPTIPPPLSPPVVVAPDWTADFRRDFDELATTLPGEVGIAISAVGSDDVTTFGSLTVGSAWSTIKVPLAIAAVRLSGSAVSGSVVNAIVQSDNAAAETLWESLGDSDSAANAVTEILREAGDSDTVVPSIRTRSEYSIFGQTQWPLDKQAGFAAHLPCIAGSAEVLDLMGNISSGQRWGLGALDSQFKGGWGPDASTGGYLVRQLGIVTGPLGRTAVSIAAQPISGLFADGSAQLGALAALIGEYVDRLPAGTCSA